MTTTRAAVAPAAGAAWDIAELELGEPRAHEVLVRFAAAGMCHSDDHLRASDAYCARYPIVGGHEGAGVVEEVGPGVTRVEAGQRVLMSFIPVCGSCRWCTSGRSALCPLGRNASTGMLPDGSFRFHRLGAGVGGFCGTGTFSERSVVSEYSCVPLPDDIAFETGALLSCGVPTGWGSAVYGGAVRPGDVVVVYGIGGVGMNAVQGARIAGARMVVAVDPVDWKRSRAGEFGATHAFAGHGEAAEFVAAATRGLLADAAIVTVGLSTPEVIRSAASQLGKGGRLVLTSSGRDDQITLSASALKGYMQRVQGVLFGNCNPLSDIPRLFDLYRAGLLKLDELITARYRLEDLSAGYGDLLDGKILRGVITYE